jgi:glycosyltransferase involved in cell wall biosynthesis
VAASKTPSAADSVGVAHPTRQHSHRFAAALQRSGLLLGYWTLLPDGRALSWLPRVLVPAAVKRNSLHDIPPEKVHALPGPLLLQKIASRLPVPSLRLMGEWMAWASFDAWVAFHVRRRRPRIVVGYEMCCARTFKAARSLGIPCLLDASAFHHETQDRLLNAGPYGAKTWAGQRLRRRKEAEIALADRIVCVSSLARQSYLDAGVDPARIVVNTVGCDVARFSRPPVPRSGPARFAFVGLPAYHKGFDILVASFERLLDRYPDAQLHLVGDTAPGSGTQRGAAGRVQVHGKLSHDELAVLLGTMDCLVLPSRLESFGMVVVEALAAGVPAIVSDHAGACEAIVEGRNGWIVPAGDGEALLGRMLACCAEIEAVRSMRSDCIRSASSYDWEGYSRRALEIVSSLMQDRIALPAKSRNWADA